MLILIVQKNLLMKSTCWCTNSSLKAKRSSKGTGRFGPFIKWDGLFINVSKKYNFDNLSQQDEVLIEDKIQKILTKYFTIGKMKVF
jgi:hypothetical protein